MAIKFKKGKKSTEAFDDEAMNIKGTGGVIKKVTADNCGGKSGTIHSAGNWRADRQNPAKGYANIQIQRNGVKGKTSIAGVLVPTDLIDGATDKPRVAELTRAIQGGLSDSVGTWKVEKKKNKVSTEFFFYEITGDFSS